MPTPSEVSPGPDLLDRHQLRRRQSIPTISVLAGPVGIGIRHWRNWAARETRPVVIPQGVALEMVGTAWVAGLAASREWK